jgi:aspartyl-tRNA(Asn)/glutamyl-tRNA(Gln) amidotransferase subunit B
MTTSSSRGDRVTVDRHFETVVGLEVHAQLATESKMYCPCSAAPSSRSGVTASPNTLVCPVCLGLPGSLPVINGQAIEFTIMTGLALNCAIPDFTRFDRKNYFYPDLPKGYQISQYDLPLCEHGSLEFQHDSTTRFVSIRRVHLEEDTGKLAHRTGSDGTTYSLVDLNRAGVPLMEIVSGPDIRSASEAGAYLRALRSILRYLGVSTGNMEEGSFRCDANVSIRPVGSEGFGVKVEVKNMNSFRAVERALDHEIHRQTAAVLAGEPIVQETRGWDDVRGITVSQRSKEFAHDYRYFPEPDLPPLTLTEERIAEIRNRLPELPAARRERFVTVLGLTPYDADVLTAEKETANYFEEAVASYPQPKIVANWVNGELRRLANAANVEVGNARVSPTSLAELLRLVDAGTISQSQAKSVFEEMFASGRPPKEIIAERGLSQISDESTLAAAVDQVILANPGPVSDYAAGKKQAQGFLVGQVMKATGGKANPALVNRLLSEQLTQPESS